MIEELKELLKIHEGTGPMKKGRHQMYQDSEDIWTIGYGRNIQERGLSTAEADFLLDNDIADSIRDCHKFDWYGALDEARQLVVTDMVFNMGLGRFMGFRKTIDFIERGLYEKASVEMMDSKWAKQVGPRAVRLSEIMKTGEIDA